MTRSWLVAVASWGMLFLASAATISAQTESPAAEPSAAQAPAEKAAPSLSERQQQLAQKYKQLEAVLLRMAELSDDPQRVALLRKAVAQSKEQLIGEQLIDIAELLERERLANALTEQGEVKQDLGKLLELLLSEDRGQNLDEEKQRLQQWIRDISNLIKDQQGLQGETEGNGDCQSIGNRQGDLGLKTGRTAKEIAEAEAKKRAEENPAGADPQPSGEPPKAPDAKPSDQDRQPNEGKPNEGKPNKGNGEEGKPTDGEAQEGQPSESQPSEGQPSEGQPSEGQPSEGQPSQGEPSQGQSSQPQEQQPQNPTEQRLRAAQQRMEAAKKKLDEAERNAAIDEQTEAIRELRAAKAELEKILQQLREEEMQRMLAMLEQRFRKMLAAQIDIYEATQRLDSVPVADRTRNDEIEAGRQSQREMELGDEARKALELLKQDGTAVAFPEAVKQLIEDMDQTASWLGEAKVGELTQALEQDIIASLEEMIAALEKAQKDLEQKENQPQQSPDSEPAEPPLVDSLAELKMVRSLQMWVNKRTQLYRERLEGELTPNDRAELEESVNKLADRQQRIFRTTRDIAQGKNQ